VHRCGLTWDLGRDNRDLRHLLSIPENMHCKRNKVSRSTIKTRDNKTVFIFKINSLARALHNFNNFFLFSVQILCHNKKNAEGYNETCVKFAEFSVGELLSEKRIYIIQHSQFDSKM
jgi:hypothetical protein